MKEILSVGSEAGEVTQDEIISVGSIAVTGEDSPFGATEAAFFTTEDSKRSVDNGN